jgi:predicted dehydrogenase
MTTDEPLKWLLVGTGDIVRKRVADALVSAKGSRLIAICGSGGRAEGLSKQFGADQSFDDLDKALAESGADAVYVATPVYRHRVEALKAIEAGKHVLIEKPLGLNGDEAQAIADDASAAKVTAGCAFYRRCFPRYVALKEAVEAGELGQSALVRTTYHAWFSPSQGDPKLWRIDPSKSGGGPLSDMGSHMFDLIIDLFGMPSSVVAYAETLVHDDWQVEDSSAVVMKMAGGAHVLASFGWNSKTWLHEFEVVGSEQRVRWHPSDSGPVVVTAGRDVIEKEMPNAQNVHRPLVEDFVEAVFSGCDPICPVHEAVKTNQLLDAIYQSAATGQVVSLSESVTR